MRARATCLLAMAVVVATAVSGCATGGRASSAQGGGGRAAGQPIVLFTPVPLTGSRQYNEIVAGQSAAAEAINQTGGIKGRPLEIRTCDTKSDPAQEAVCAQEILSSKATAVISQASGRSTAIADLTNENKIASIGGQGFGSTDSLQESVASFPLTTSPTAPMACPAGLAAGGHDRFAAMVADLASGALIAEAAEAGTKRIPGASWTKTIKLLPEATDMAGYFQTALDSQANGVIVAGSVTQTVGAIQANNNRIGLCGADALTVDALTTLGPVANGWTVMSTPPTLDLVAQSGPDGALFVKDMAAYQAAGNSPYAAEGAWRTTTLSGWMGVRAFQRVAEKLDEVTSKSVFDAFTRTTDLAFPGLLPSPIDFTRFQPIPAFARVFQPQYTAYRWNAATKHFEDTGTTVDLIDLLNGR